MLKCIVAVAVTWWSCCACLARAEVLVLRNQPFVLAARLMGVCTLRIILRHMRP